MSQIHTLILLPSKGEAQSLSSRRWTGFSDLLVINRTQWKWPVWLPRLGHKRHCGFTLAVALESPALGKAGCQVWALKSPTEESTWWGTEVSTSRPEGAILKVALLPPPRLQIMAALAKILTATSWESELGPPSEATTRFHTLRNYEMINVLWFSSCEISG